MTDHTALIARLRDALPKADEHETVWCALQGFDMRALYALVESQDAEIARLTAENERLSERLGADASHRASRIRCGLTSADVRRRVRRSSVEHCFLRVDFLAHFWLIDQATYKNQRNQHE
jgi:hypothetical protein